MAGGWGTDARTKAENNTRVKNRAEYFICTRLSPASPGFNSPIVICPRLTGSGCLRSPLDSLSRLERPDLRAWQVLDQFGQLLRRAGQRGKCAEVHGDHLLHF